MRTETKKLEKDGKVAEYSVKLLDTFDELVAEFEGKMEDLLKWASANLPSNRNEYQKARIATEPPIRQFATAALGLHKTGLAQFAEISAAVAAVLPESHADIRDRVIKLATDRLAKAAA